jgi:hypothetical protein
MIGSPYTLGRNSTSTIMLKVMLALVPGIVAHAWLFGPGIWVSLLLCSFFAIGFEAFLLLMRGLPIKPFLSDNSALLTAWLLALSLPTLAPWWLYAIGMLASPSWWPSNLYGGIGQNLFNPAMVGYAALIVSFPVYMTQWAAPVLLADHTLTLWDAFDVVFAGTSSISADAYTSATVLDTWKTQARLQTPADTILAQPIFGMGRRSWSGNRGWHVSAGRFVSALGQVDYLAYSAGFPDRGGRQRCRVSPDRPNAARLPIAASVFRRRHAGCFLHCHRSGHCFIDTARQTDLRRYGRHSDDDHPRPRRLSGWRGLCRAADECLRALHRHLSRSRACSGHKLKQADKSSPRP